MQSLHDSDMVLWQRLKLGDTEALGFLYDRYVDELFGYGQNFSKEKQFIMDSIHDLFLNLFKYRKNLSNTDNVKYYLYRSLKNQMLKTSNNRVVEIAKTKISENLATDSIEEELIQSEYFDERTARLYNAISFLSKKQKQGLYLRFTEDRQYEEIAEIMHVSVQTSRTIIYRAIKALRANLTSIIVAILFFL